MQAGDALRRRGSSALERLDKERPSRNASGLGFEVPIGVWPTVNTTQRIEQLAKLLCPDQLTVACLVSARTRLQAGFGLRFTDAGPHAVRGR
jgi:hypothetical protein